MNLINWHGLSDQFRAMRGEGVSYHTIQAWQVMGMPYIQQGRRIWYQWDECWEWYLERFSVRKAG
jgi:hypothetical protein